MNSNIVKESKNNCDKYDNLIKIDNRNKKKLMKELYLYTQKGMIVIMVILGLLSVIKNLTLYFLIDNSIKKDYYGYFNYFNNLFLYSPYIYLKEINNLTYWIKEISEISHNFLTLLWLTIFIILIINRYIEILIYTNDLTIYSLEISNWNDKNFKKILKENSINEIKKLEINYNEIIEILLTKSSFDNFSFERLNIMDYKNFINKNYYKKEKIENINKYPNNFNDNNSINNQNLPKKRNLNNQESNLNLIEISKNNINIQDESKFIENRNELINKYKNNYINLFKGFFITFYDLSHTKDIYSFYKLDIIKDKLNHFKYIKKNDDRKFILESLSNSKLNFCRDFYDLNIQNLEKKDSFWRNAIFLTGLIILLGLTIFIQINLIKSSFLGRKIATNTTFFISDLNLYFIQIVTLIIFKIIKTLYEIFISQKEFQYFSEITNVKDIKSFFIDIIGGLFFYIISFTISITTTSIHIENPDILRAFRIKLNFNCITISLTNFGVFLVFKIITEIFLKILNKIKKNKQIRPLSAFQKQNEKIKYYNVSNNTIIICKLFSYLGFIESRYSNILFFILLIFSLVNYFLENKKLKAKNITNINIQNIINIPLLSLLGYFIGIIFSIIYNYFIIQKENKDHEYILPLNNSFGLFIIFLIFLIYFFNYNNLSFNIQNKLLYLLDKDETKFNIKKIKKLEVNLNEYKEKIKYKVKNIYYSNLQLKEFLDIIKNIN